MERCILTERAVWLKVKFRLQLKWNLPLRGQRSTRGAPGVMRPHVVLVISWLPLPAATRCRVIDEGLFILLLLMDRKWPPTTSDLSDPRSMLGNKLTSCHTHTHTHTVTHSVMRRWSQQLASALFHLPVSLHPAGFPPARPGGLWEGDGFWRSFSGLTLRGQRRGESPPALSFSSLKSLFRSSSSSSSSSSSCSSATVPLSKLWAPPDVLQLLKVKPRDQIFRPQSIYQNRNWIFHLFSSDFDDLVCPDLCLPGSVVLIEYVQLHTRKNNQIFVHNFNRASEQTHLGTFLLLKWKILL